MRKRRLRKLPPLPVRLETGAVQCGHDWPGLFLRGDDCISLAASLETVLDSLTKAQAMAVAPHLGPLVELLQTIRAQVLVNAPG